MLDWKKHLECQTSCLGGLKETKMFLPHPRVKVSIVGSPRDREVACSASDRQGSNFESCVWRTVSSQSSHHLQEVLLAQFSLYVHKGGLKPDSFHFICQTSSAVDIENTPFKRQIIQLEFSPIWICVSLTRPTTSSEWKLFRFDKIEVNDFEISLFCVTFYL